MSFFPFFTKYQLLKMEYLRKKIEQMLDIEELEKELVYLQQFVEPDITIRLGADELQYIAETSIFNLDNPQPHFIQIVVGQKPEFKDFIEVSEKGRELIMKKLTLLYPNQFQ
jgi:hypothetical protein